MLNINKKEINLLIVSFARSEDQWELSLEEREKIIRLNYDKEIKFNLATEAKFVSQLKKADSVYLRGGNCYLITNILKKYSDLKDLFDGKIIAGSSAGVDVLAKYYYDNDYDAIEKGLGVLPIKAICHYGKGNTYGKDFYPKLQKLKNYNEDLETVALKETEFIIREVR